jgi:hypothetical protein
MNYCEHCGYKLEGHVPFCGNCGARLVKNDQLQPVNVASPKQPFANTQQPVTSHAPITKNKKMIGTIAAVVIAAIILFNFLPKKMSQTEYVNFVIDHLVGISMDHRNFGEFVNDSDVDFDTSDFSVAEARVLLKPAQQFQEKVANRYKELKKVKPPASFKNDHDHLLKAIDAQNNAAATFVSFIKSGDERYEDVYDQYEETASSYIENSIFATDLYQEQMEERYKQMSGY